MFHKFITGSLERLQRHLASRRSLFRHLLALLRVSAAATLQLRRDLLGRGLRRHGGFHGDTAYGRDQDSVADRTRRKHRQLEQQWEH